MLVAFDFARKRVSACNAVATTSARLSNDEVVHVEPSADGTVVDHVVSAALQ